MGIEPDESYDDDDSDTDASNEPDWAPAFTCEQSSDEDTDNYWLRWWDSRKMYESKCRYPFLLLFNTQKNHSYTKEMEIPYTSYVSSEAEEGLHVGYRGVDCEFVYCENRGSIIYNNGDVGDEAMHELSLKDIDLNTLKFPCKKLPGSDYGDEGKGVFLTGTDCPHYLHAVTFGYLPNHGKIFGINSWHDDETFGRNELKKTKATAALYDPEQVEWIKIKPFEYEIWNDDMNFAVGVCKNDYIFNDNYVHIAACHGNAGRYDMVQNEWIVLTECGDIELRHWMTPVVYFGDNPNVLHIAGFKKPNDDQNIGFYQLDMRCDKTKWIEDDTVLLENSDDLRVDTLFM